MSLIQVADQTEWQPFFGSRGWHPGARLARQAALRARRAERSFATQLRQIATQINNIVKGLFEPDNITGSAISIGEMLSGYADLITPWAQATSNRMLADVSRRDAAGWHQLGQEMGRAITQEIATTPMTQMIADLRSTQVELIRSLPLRARERVHELSLQSVTGSMRWEEVAEEIMRQGEVSQGHANTIARTETSRAQTEFQKARAEHLGSPGYVWRTSRDRDVRPIHRALEGTFHRWNEPPIAGERGERAHPGSIYNCFPGSIEVSLENGCHWLWRYWYQGPLITIELENGSVAEATGNHPILTRRGWVAAEDIQTSDYIVCCFGNESFLVAEDKDKHQRQPTFDEIFRSLDILTGRKTTSAFMFDFHGERPDYDVDAIRADHLLPGDQPPALLKALCDHILARTNSGMIDAVHSGGLQISKAYGARSTDEVFSGLGSHALHSSNIGLRPSSSRHAVSFKYGSDFGARAIKTERQRQFAFSSLISMDDFDFREIPVPINMRTTAAQLDAARFQMSSECIRGANSHFGGNLFDAHALSVKERGLIGGLGDFAMSEITYDPTSAEMLAESVSIAQTKSDGGLAITPSGKYQFLRPIKCGIRSFAGHVYTMQTANGWFAVTSAGIVAKNCRCWSEPVLAGETPQTGPLPRSPEYLAALRQQGYSTGTAFE